MKRNRARTYWMASGALLMVGVGYLILHWPGRPADRDTVASQSLPSTSPKSKPSSSRRPAPDASALASARAISSGPSVSGSHALPAAALVTATSSAPKVGKPSAAPAAWAEAFARFQAAAKAYAARHKDGDPALAEKAELEEALRALLGLKLGDSPEVLEQFRKALELLWDTLGRDGVAAMAELLWAQPDDASRLAAAFLWDRLQYDHADPAFAGRLTGEVLAYLADLMGRDALDPNLKRLSVLGLGYFLQLFPDNVQGVVSVERAMASADAQTRWTVAVALGNTHSLAALEELKRLMLNDPDPQVRSVAAWGLGGYPAGQVADVMDELRSRMAKGDEFATMALALLNDEATVDHLLPMISTYAGYQVYDFDQGALLSGGLWRLINDENRPEVAALLQNQDPRVRANAAAALARAGDDEGHAILLQTLDQHVPVPGGRLELYVLLGLARLKDDRARAGLQAIVQGGDPDRSTQAQAGLDMLDASPSPTP